MFAGVGLWLISLFVVATTVAAQPFQVGHEVVATQHTEIKVKGRILEKFDLGGSFAPSEVNGAWLRIGRGWVHSSAVMSPEKAEPFFESLVQREPDNWHAWFGLGNSRRIIGKYEEALEALDRARETDPNGEKTYHSIRSVIHSFRYDWDAAIEEASLGITLIQDDPAKIYNLAALYQNRGMARDEKGQEELALADLTKALELAPSFQIAMVRRGVLLRDMGRAKEAIAQLTDAIEQSPKTYMPPVVDRGVTYFNLRDWRRAAKDFRTVVSSEPDDAFVKGSMSQHVYAKSPDQPIAAKDLPLLDPRRSGYYNLIVLLAACPDDSFRDGDEAVRLATKLRELDGGRYFHFVAAEAAAYAEAGNFEKAIELQEEAIEVAPPDERASFELTLAGYRSGKPYRLPAEKNAVGNG